MRYACMHMCVCTVDLSVMMLGKRPLVQVLKNQQKPWKDTRKDRGWKMLKE